MKRFITALLLVGVVLSARAAFCDEYPERWILGYGKKIIEREDADDFVAFVNEAAGLGYTHIIFDDFYSQTSAAMPPKYFEHAAMVKKAAEDAGITIVPGIFSYGYSWRILWHDSNLAAGLPVVDQPFKVEGTQATADASASPTIINPGFSAAIEAETPGWTSEEGVDVCLSFDETDKHSGDSSLKMTDFDKLPMVEGRRGRPGRPRRKRPKPCSVSQTLAVEPFKYYRLTVWRKTQGLEASGSSIGISSADGKRRLSYTNFEIDPVQDWNDYVAADSDWREFQLTFNTLESTAISVSVGVQGAKSGAIWWDDIKIEPAGLANLLRGATKPFVVKSADGKTVYEEGRDFIYVEDPLMGKAPMPDWLSYLPPGGSFDIWHEGPAIRLTENSGIKDGDTILVSYYHPHIIYGHQVVGSMTDPKIFEVFDDQMKRIVEVWDAKAYMMGYDEIRVGGWEKQPGGTQHTVGKLLADHITMAVAVARKHAPDAELFIWSDMFDPFHNAREREGQHGYYLCNGNFEGSWEGLPGEVGIIKWAGGGRPCLEFFANRGHKIVISAGYRPGAVTRWKKDAVGIDKVAGFMFTNWQEDYSGLGAYMKAIEEPYVPKEEAEESTAE